jgi:ribosome maturation factor RimP
MNRVETLVAQMAGPVVAAQGCSLWAVEYAKEGGGWVLRVLLDREGGVNTDHCEAISRALDPLLDEADPIPGAYTLEVSSAGLERPLKRPEDFARSLGREVLVRLYVAKDGAREFIGPLTGHDGQTLTLEGHPPFPVKEVALARLYVRW